ncbi:hypothetical protein LAZ67_1007875 [Cordylochernes scorpioides]|uniref:Uncharacterized protein n=1 Tax=Cordylochernes scorpioides TaxID=51811 RepID=A0ABY6K370_9ARAC|nr:hypothetical protein LAZ67_1007875 [Cordylochernes scorpioides]
MYTRRDLYRWDVRISRAQILHKFRQSQAAVNVACMLNMLDDRFEEPGENNLIRRLRPLLGMRICGSRAPAKKELNLKAYNLQKVKLFKDENKRERLERCRQLKHRATGVKSNQEVYCRNIVETFVLLWARQHFGDADWTFQQDSVSAHDVKLNQDWCRDHFPDFITSAE